MWTKTRRHRGNPARRPLFHSIIIGIALVAAAYASFSPARTVIQAQGNSFIGPSIEAPSPPDTVLVRVEQSTAVASRFLPSTITPPAEMSSLSAPDATVTPENRVQALQVASPTPEATATLAATPTPVSDGCVRDSGHPLYCIYTVQSGDTLTGIAARYGIKGTHAVSGGEMLAQSNKPDVIDSDEISPGQKLRVPLTSGIIHTVFTPETLAQLAADYGVSRPDIQAANGNIAAELSVGQELLVPSPVKLPATASANAPDADALAAGQETATPTASPQATATPTAQVAVPPTIAAVTSTVASATATPTARGATASPTATQTVAAPAKSKAGFIWPASGPISSPFGPSHPLGIDIDFYANPNQGVAAAAAGTVTFAGGNSCCSYGYYVIIDHGNGFTTLYAHLSRYVVSVGQKVTQGQLLGYGGKTGYATGEHLHFEMRYDGLVVNPQQYLP